jgi:hypothetical protein
MHEIPITFADSPWISLFLATHRRMNRSMEQFGWYDKSEYAISDRKAEKITRSARSPQFPPISTLTVILGGTFQLRFPSTLVGLTSTKDLMYELQHL